MDAVLVKIFAAALTFSQVATGPEAVTTRFDPVEDRQQVVGLLRNGCAQMRKAFDIEDLNIDDLIATAMDDPDAIAGGHAAFRGLNVKDLHTAYRQFCKNETVENSPVDVGDVIEFYNRTLTDLPDHTRLKSMKLPGASVVLDLKGERVAEVFEQYQRRVWVSLTDIPAHVQRAIVAAEDKRFYQHKGIDELAMIRAFIGNLAQSGRPQGGSTITQQVVKNLLVGDEITYERKIREMILASRLERTLTKAEILEVYLNSVYLGRASWGVEMAARGYFGKSAPALTLSEGVLLAALVKGPTYFNPDRRPDRARERINYVLGRMREDGAITADQAKDASVAIPVLAPYEGSPNLTGSYFADHLAREIRNTSGLSAFRVDSYTIHSTLHPQLQRVTEVALQEGLARYEIDSGRTEFQEAEANLADAIRRIEAERRTPPGMPAWQRALDSARLPLHDVHWRPAVVIAGATMKKSRGTIEIGLSDGRVLPLSGQSSNLAKLRMYDVVMVHIGEGKGKAARAELRVRPVVQGAAVVLENRTGRILAMAGGFSYALNQLNRITQSQRQPGSALKPLTYLAALQKGLQPNTLVRDEEITLLPPNGGTRLQDYWTPKNYDGGTSGIITLRRALENSKNLATANLLEGGIAPKAPTSLQRICALSLDLQIYRECIPYYPFVLGAQPVRPIDLATFYATTANEGTRPSPYAIETIEQNGKIVYRHSPTSTPSGAADPASYYQLKSMLQGVLERGTARRIASLAPYVAGKTGTSDDENDAWFVGFTNDVTIAIWVGYDNADGKRRTLGAGRTGGSVAVPIFEPIIQAVWEHHAQKQPLSPPSPEAKRLLTTAKIDGNSRDASNKKGLVEYLRLDDKGRAIDTRYDLVSRRDASSRDGEQRRRRHAERPPHRDGWGEWSFWGSGRSSSWSWQGQDASQRYGQGQRAHRYYRFDYGPSF